MKTSISFRRYLVILGTSLTLCYAVGTFMEKVMPAQFPNTYATNHTK